MFDTLYLLYLPLRYAVFFFQLSLPSVLKKKRPEDYKIRAFVGIMFLTIAFIIGFAYVVYQQQVLQVCWYGCVYCMYRMSPLFR
jgi:hypothetical protein